MHLPENFLKADNGAGNQFGEHGDVQTDEQRVFFFGRPFPVNIHGVGDSLKYDEGNAQGQSWRRKRDFSVQKRNDNILIDIVKEKSRIFKIRENRYIERDGREKKNLFPERSSVFGKRKAKKVVRADNGKQKKDIKRLSPRVKEKTGHQKNGIFPRKGKIKKQEERQKNKQKCGGTKNHKQNLR